jgi:predicted DNA-binding protein
MGLTRTQVYLTEEQRERIDRAAHARGVTMAEIIRSALDEYLEHDNDPSSALSATFGADPAVAPPSRDEWARG